MATDLLDAPDPLPLSEQWQRQRAVFDAHETLRAVDGLLFSLELRLIEAALNEDKMQVALVRAQLLQALSNMSTLRAPFAGEAA